MSAGGGGEEQHADRKERGHLEGSDRCTQKGQAVTIWPGGGSLGHISELRAKAAGCEEGRPSIQNPVYHVSLENNFIQREKRKAFVPSALRHG